jgi:signal transduction histidine kinase
MKMGRILAVLAGVLIAGVALFAAIIGGAPDTRFDMAGANDVVKTLAADWEGIKSGGAPNTAPGLQYVVFDESGKAVYATGEGMCKDLNEAIRSRYIVMDVEKDGRVVGKAGFYNDIEAVMSGQRRRLIVGAAALSALLFGLCAAYAVYLSRRVVAPFNRMQGFARRVASGTLEVPLDMDRGHLFGAFTESFDIMREELRRARESEREANRSKKELVASLSHDIKTPVATIKAVAEVMLALARDGREKERLRIVEAKAEQINSLITDMFHATMEELQELRVNPAEIPSGSVSGLVRGADYEGRVGAFTLPDCIVLADALRLSQVFDNMIGNSYKYAGTPIEIEAAFEEGCLIIGIKDFGEGVSGEDLSMITEKFYRGKNAAGKNGHGLGLYISKYLMDQMRGGLVCENRPDGFLVKIILRLAS